MKTKIALGLYIDQSITTFFFFKNKQYFGTWGHPKLIHNNRKNKDFFFKWQNKFVTQNIHTISAV